MSRDRAVPRDWRNAREALLERLPQIIELTVLVVGTGYVAWFWVWPWLRGAGWGGPSAAVLGYLAWRAFQSRRD